MMINKVLEKRQVDEDSDSDYVDLEEDFDPVINKGFCKSIYPLIVKLFVSKQRKYPYNITYKTSEKNNKNNHLTSPNPII